LLGLKWQDVDPDGGKLSVRCSLVISKKDGVGFSDPKRKKSRRSIKLSLRTLDALGSHPVRQNEERLRLGAAWQDNELLFPAGNGSPMRPWSFIRGSFKRLSSVRDSCRTSRSTRPPATTLLLGKGVHPKLLQELLGHATVAITLDTYTHVLPSMDDGIADTMDEAIS
jgi:integrase